MTINRKFKNIKYYLPLLRGVAALVLSGSVLTASCSYALEQAGKEIAFLDAGSGARAVGMGNAYTSVANDSDSVYWNPAGMMFAGSFELGSMRTKLGSDLDVYQLSTLVQNKKFSYKDEIESAWGFYWVNGAINDIPLVSANGTADPDEDIKPDDYSNYQANALGISYASWLMKNVAWGVSVTGFYKDFDNIDLGKGAGITITPGVMWVIDYNMVFGLVIKDMFNYQKWKTGTEEYVYSEIRAGISWAPIEDLILVTELRKKMDDRYVMTYNLGAEYTLFNFIKLRAGYDEDRFTAGCGFYTNNINVNYAYTGDITDGIGDSHRVGIGFRY